MTIMSATIWHVLFVERSSFEKVVHQYTTDATEGRSTFLTAVLQPVCL